MITVTGGARGLGLVQVEALIEAGAAGVCAFDKLPAPDPKFEELRTKCVGQRLEYKQIDITRTEGLKESFAEVTAWKGRLDGLVAAAGIQHEAAALEYTAEDCRRILDVNVPLHLYGTYDAGHWRVSVCSSSGRANDSNQI